VRIAHARGELNGQCTSPTLEGTIQDVTDRLDGEHAITPREREVLDLMAEGLTGTEIASRLQISPETVRSHVQNAIGKLDAHNRVHAVVLALRAREIDL
jgi:DNA-binding CsgD family transcriptional regulator